MNWRPEVSQLGDNNVFTKGAMEFYEGLVASML
jgi:hypothetical protein